VLYGDVDGVWRVMPPRVRAVNAVGSGDALVAGFVVGVADGAPVLDAVRLGVACGASNASRFEPGIGSRGEVETLASRVEVAARP
jgi:fructose-1-phosphate kinase PfkB-like protein